MRITKLMGLAVTTVALAVTINALAFQTADVTNAMSITVSSTTVAGLAFDAPTGSPDGATVSTASNELSITFSENVQPNSTYTFDPVFKITNNGATSKTLGYSTSGFTGVTISLYQTGTSSDLAGYSLAAGASVEVKVGVTTATGTATGAKSGTIIVTGQ